MTRTINFDKIINDSFDYISYRSRINELISIGQTTGKDQTEKLIDFTKLNIQRMNRLDKTIHLKDEMIHQIKSINRATNILVIGDAWCGDCAQIIPVINKITIENKNKIKLNIISRDQSLDLIEMYGNNGIISIPKILFIDSDSHEILNTWGSRPKPALQILQNWKDNKDTMSHEDFEKELHLWYARDKGVSIINEFLEILEKL